jgi:hypothetical protein
MKMVRIGKATASSWVGLSLGAALLLSAGAMPAQNNKPKPSAPAAAPKPAAAAPKPAAAPAAAHPAPGGGAAVGRAGGAAPAGRAGAPAGGATGRAGAPAGAAAGRSGAPSGVGAGRTVAPGGAAAGRSGAPSGAAASHSGGPGGAAGRAGAPGGAAGRAGAPTGRPGGEHAAIRPGMSRDAHGRNEFHGSNGHEAHYARDGHVREVRGRDSHGRDMAIRHDARGGRVIERGDHRVYVNRAGHGYVDRRFGYHGHEYAARSYYYHGRPYAVYYNHYGYHGVFLEGYAPVAYYPPAFYGWVYNPWVAPVPYTWGFVAAPWYAAYGWYFTPYPVYASASLWLTDYLIAQSLEAAYQERQDAAAAAAAAAAPAAGGPVVMTPEVKQAIAAEVQRQIALENAEAQTQAKTDVDPNSSGLPRMLAEASPTNPRIFVLGAALTVDDATGQECSLTEGDVLRLTGPTPADATTANLQVFASKPQECAKGATVAVQLTDLQEMQNHMRANIDNGMKDLQAHQGGLPAPPPSAAAPPTPAAYAPVAPPPDPNVASELAQEAKDADAAENEVLAEAKQSDQGQGDTAPPAGAPAAAAAAPPTELSVGQTPEQVTAALGQPKQIVKLGAKQIYVYPDMKVTFVNGKVSDIQ